MKRIVRKRIELLFHIFFWIVFAAFAIILSKIYLQVKPEAPFGQHLFTVITIEVVMGMIFFYVTFFGYPWAKRKKRYLVILSLILFFLLLFFALPATRFGLWEVMSSVIPHVAVILIAFVFRKFSDSIKLEQEKQTLLLQRTQSELALLKMQVSPHFLFNTLNNIDYLVSTDTSKASWAISRLGCILRYMIYESSAEKLTLSKELNHIEDYLELMRLRMFDPEYLTYQSTGSAGHLQIAPMLLQPLVENAYKHASTRDGQQVIKMVVKIDGNVINFTIDNEYDSLEKSEAEEGGIGLNIVRRRLELIYPGKHQLIISKDERKFKAALTIELDEY
jgi:LytS/YehU family sensor histidine kinase